MENALPVFIASIVFGVLGTIFGWEVANFSWSADCKALQSHRANEAVFDCKVRP